LRIVPRGIDLLRFDPVRTTADRMVRLARECGLPDGVPVVLLPGRLTRWKGHEVLFEALRRLGRSDLHCLVVGSGAPRYRRELETSLATQPLPCSFALVEDCRDMAALYMLADVVVSASTEPEGFGRIAVEAQAMGRPVIATAHGGALETVVPGETGWLVRPGDPADLAKALADALALGPERRTELAVRATEHVRARFTVEVMTARTIAVYEELVATETLPEDAISA
jgi:glycosyltransferase involved in cell wall biosynthesis